MVYGLGFMVWGLLLRVPMEPKPRLGTSGSGFRVYALNFRPWGLGFRV